MKSQADKLHDLLSDHRPHRTDEILSVVYGGSHLGIARISARILDVKKRLAAGQAIRSYPDPVNPTLWFYVMDRAPLQAPEGELFGKRLGVTL